jgi:uncharacterized protein with beta-barrel porin domain
MSRHPLRVTLLATSSALAMIVALDPPASAASCTVVTNHALPFTYSGNTCAFYNATPAGSGSVTSSGTVSATGTGPAAIGIDVSGANIVPSVSLNGGLTNAGTITGGAGIIMDQSTISGSIVNSTGASINAGQGINVQGAKGAGGHIATVGGSIINNGTINTTVEGGIGVGDAVVTGGVTNTGAISAAGAPISISEATLGGSVVNTGKLVAISGSVAMSIANGGSIGGSVSNSGNITVTHAGGLAIQVLPNGSETQTIGGSVINDVGGTMTAPIGIGLVAFGTPGAVIVKGNVANNGTINASVTGIQVLSATIGGKLTNSGTITAGEYGIQLMNLATPGAIAGPPSVAGGVVNSGSITSTGSGFAGIVLNGAKVFNGITNASGGTINVAKGVGILLTNQSQFTNTSGTATTITGGAATVSGGITNNGTITAKTGIMVTGGSVVIGGITNSGDLSGSVNAINLTGEGAPTTIDVLGGAITGNIVGGGGDVVNFGGASPGTFAYSGAISAVSAVNVNSGFTLYDNGSISASTVTVMNNGTLAPGAPGTPGTLNITGSLVFQSAATYMVQLTPATASQTNVNGTATLSGAVDAVFLPGTYMTKQYDILHVTGGGVGGANEFTSLTTTNKPADVTANLSYDNNDVFLNLTAQLGNSGGLNQNQQSVANAINTFFNNGGALPPGFAAILNLTGANLANALTQLDGENATGAEHSAFQLMNQFLDLMLDPYVDGRSGFGSGGQPLGFAPDQADSLPPDIALAYAGVLKAPPKPTFEQRWTAWGAGFGGSATTNGDPIVGSNNVTTSTYGYAAGMDYHYSPDTVLGFALAGGGTNWNLAQGLGTGRSDAFLAGIYGVTHQGPIYLAGSLAFANNWFTTNRTALGDQLTASFEGQSYAARLEGGYRFAVPFAHNAIGITPYAAIQAQNFHTPAYSETDLTSGGFGLSYAAMNGTDTRSELGARFDDPTLLGNMPLILRARVAWAHDWVSNPALNAAFESLPGTSFTVNGAPIPPNSALTSAGAELFFTPNWSLLAKFDGEFAKGSQLYAGTGTLRYTW